MKNLIFSILLLFPIIYVSGQEISWREMSGNKNANFYDIQNDFNNYWRDKTPSRGQGYGVFKRWEARMIPRVYPTGNLVQTNISYQNFKQWEKDNQSTDRSPSGNWVEVGPLSKPSGYDAGVGRVDFVKFNPTNSNIMYVSTPDGGLWKTTNGNDPLPTWTTYNDFLPVIGCSDLAIAPDGTTMYLATGSWELDKNSIGILKSTNGGETWTTTSLSWDLSENYKLRRLIMDPTNPLVMLAASDGGIYRTTDGWATKTLTNLDGSFNIHDIKFKPGDSNTVYASGKHVGDPTNNEIFWKSTNNGVSWTYVDSGLPNNSLVSRIIIGVSAANADYVYLLAGNTNGGYLGTYRSSNSGTSFSTMSSYPSTANILHTDFPTPTNQNNGQATHDLAIAVAPNNINTLTIGGINQYRSTDGGATWTLLTYWYGEDPNYPGVGDNFAPYLHADVQSITYFPGSNTTIYSTCDGGISRSTDHGSTWTDISNNLRVAQQTDISLSNNDALMIAGLQDIGNLKNVGGVYTYIGGGDGESNFIDYTNNQHLVTSDPNGNYSLSKDGGANRTSLNDNGLPAGTEFFSPIVQDPNTSTTCYAGGRPNLYKSTNYLNVAYTWNSIGTPSGTGSITRFVVAPSNSQVIYTLKENAVSKTTNGGSNWTNVTGSLPVGDAYIRNITISNTDADKVWVVFSGYSATNKVFKTTDGGSNWTNITGSLPNVPINTIKYRNGSNDEIYIGADIGVYVTNNSLSGVWKPFMSGLAKCTVNDLEIYYPTGKIRAATYGRGTWESNLYTGDPTVLLAAKVFLEGPYNIGQAKMSNGLGVEKHIPTKDPYPGLGYTHVAGELEGSNSVTLLNNDANNAIVDWVFVELRDNSNPATVQYTRSALLQRDGDIVDMDGVSALHFSNAPSGNYYVAIRHRNHLGFRTNASIALSGTATNLNFTNNTVPTFGTNALKEITSGVYGMYSGDANGDGEINAVDFNLNWKVQNAQLGYKKSDLNLDGEVNAVDLLNHWQINNSKIQQLD